jgi:hypothetical protein
MRRSRILTFTVSAIAFLAASTYVQRRWFGEPTDVPIDPAPAYDGRFTFARLKFPTAPGGYYFRGLPAWAHGYISTSEGRRAELNLVKILDAITIMKPHVDGTRVVDVTDPDLFEYPIVYATEPGFMELDDHGAKALHDYIEKGGFVILDDFRGANDWGNFCASMARVEPGETPIQLDLSSPVFHSFFEIGTLEFHQAYDRGQPEFYGMFPNNDRSKPMQMIVNFNNDVSEYWEYSDTGIAPVDLSNEAYKLGVNYVIYAMTH